MVIATAFNKPKRTGSTTSFCDDENIVSVADNMYHSREVAASSTCLYQILYQELRAEY